VPAVQLRAFAVAIAGRRVPGSIDLTAAVARAARRRALEPLPTRWRWSVGRGVQVHVQRSPSMEPFESDVAALVSALRGVVAPAALQVFGFETDPTVMTFPPRALSRYRLPAGRLRADCDPDDRPVDVLLPHGGGTVLVLTDFGVGRARHGPRTAGIGRWTAHHRAAREAGRRVLYLTPYPPGRWPPAARELPCVYWRDGLRVAEARAALVRSDR
jgi:hypothetical protein